MAPRVGSQRRGRRLPRHHRLRHEPRPLRVPGLRRPQPRRRPDRPGATARAGVQRHALHLGAGPPIPDWADRRGRGRHAIRHCTAARRPATASAVRGEPWPTTSRRPYRARLGHPAPGGDRHHTITPPTWRRCGPRSGSAKASVTPSSRIWPCWTPPCRSRPSVTWSSSDPRRRRPSVAKWLAKIGGRGGYVLSVQHPDPDAVRARALARGVRVPIDTTAFGQAGDPAAPAGRRTAARDGRRSPMPPPGSGTTSIPGPEPGALRRRDRRRRGAGGRSGGDERAVARTARPRLRRPPDTIDLGGIPVRFVPGGPSADWTVLLRRAADGGERAGEPTLPGITFRLV